MSIAVVSPRPELHRWALAAAVADGGTTSPVVLPVGPGSTQPLAELAETVGRSASVVVVDAMDDPAAAVMLAGQLRAANDVAVVLVGRLGAGELTGALRAGVADVVDPHSTALELLEVLRRVARPVAVDPEVAAPQDGPGRTVVVLAPKGGSGKTTVSCNLAVELARRDQGKVVLVDLDVQFGDVAAAMGLDVEHDLTDAVAALGRGEGVKLALARHSSGCYVLCGPDDPVAADAVEPAATRALLDALAEEFRYVVVDTAAGLDEHTLGAVEAADDLVVLASTDVATVHNARKSLRAIEVVGATRARRHVVVNRADANVGIRLEDIEANLGAPVDAVVPQDRQVVVGHNQGVPVVVSDPRSAAGRALTALADRFCPQPSPTARRWKVRR